MKEKQKQTESAVAALKQAVSKLKNPDIIRLMNKAVSDAFTVEWIMIEAGDYTPESEDFELYVDLVLELLAMDIDDDTYDLIVNDLSGIISRKIIKKMRQRLMDFHIAKAELKARFCEQEDDAHETV